MILSFSVPDNERYRPIIEWYKFHEKAERSREFRKILLLYLAEKIGNDRISSVAQMEKTSNPKEPSSINIERVDITGGNANEDDLDSRLDILGLGDE